MSEIDVMREFAAQIVSNGLARSEELVGCSEEEVADVERRARVRLPGMYRAFLQTLGRGAGQFLRGSVAYYPGILGLTEDAQELLDEDKLALKLPDDALAFFMHQGYQFAYFRTDQGDDDPEVCHFVEGENRLEPDGRTYTRWLQDALEDEVRIRRRR